MILQLCSVLRLCIFTQLILVLYFVRQQTFKLKKYLKIYVYNSSKILNSVSHVQNIELFIQYTHVLKVEL